MNKSLIRLTFPQRVAVSKKLEEVCKKGPGGNAVYNPGWNDAKVAEFMGQPVNHLHVKRVRVELIGKLHENNQLPENNPGSLAARVTAIEEYLTRVEPTWKTPTLI